MSAFLDQMSGLSSAEDFFKALDVPFDEHVVRVNRLHILKRMHDYLGKEETAPRPTVTSPLRTR
jgi:nitrogenase-stabilizing/protective protein